MMKLVSTHPAKNYIDFEKFKVRWDLLISDIMQYCYKNHPEITHINFNDTEMTLNREIIFNTKDKEYKFYIGLDINGEIVNFLFCRFSDFEHYATVNILEELIEIMWTNIRYN